MEAGNQVKVPMSELMNTLGISGGTYRHSVARTEDLEAPPPHHHPHSLSDDEGSPQHTLKEPGALINRTWTFTVPWFGRMQILKDVQGLIFSSVIIFYWVYGNWSTWLLILLPRYYDDMCPIGMLVCELLVSTLRYCIL